MSEQAGFRILLVDDRPLVRIPLRTALAKVPDCAAVAEAHDGREALGMLGRLQPDLVVCAAGLTGLSAIETCAGVKGQLPGAKTVIVATVADPLLLEQAVLAGVDGIVTGELSVKEFVAALRRTMGGEVVVPAAQVPMLLQRLTHRRHESDALMHRFLRLTRREREVLQYIVDGHNHRAVASALYISPQTARRHIHNLLSKLEMHSCVEAATRCVAEGLVAASEQSRPVQVTA